MTTAEKFHFVRDTQRYMLQAARLDKPSGSWPEWVDSAEWYLNNAAYALRAQIRREASEPTLDQLREALLPILQSAVDPLLGC